MLVIECVMLFRFDSARLKGSYDELGVNCGGVVDDMLVVDAV